MSSGDNSTKKRGIPQKDVDSEFRIFPFNETKKIEEEEKAKNWLEKLFSKRVELKVNRPLIPLKIALALWYGAGAVVTPFLLVYFTQLGITVKELSIIYIIAPAVQLAGSTVSGLIADKIGRSKPVLIANILLFIVFLNSMLLIPSVKQKCEGVEIHLECNPQLKIKKGIDDLNSSVPFVGHRICSARCPEIPSAHICPEYLTTPCSPRNSNFSNLKLFLDVSNTSNATSTSGNFTSEVHFSLLFRNASIPWCDDNITSSCNLSCILEEHVENDTCSFEDNRAFVFTLSLVVLLLFHTTFSNCYRFMDVTAMAMVTAHNSDFGHERFWPIFSILLLSPFSGFLVKITTPFEGPQNYAIAFYLCDVLALLTIAATWKLDVKINPPGKKLWKKTLYLLKNPDIVMFGLAVVVLGTSWGFTKIFSYVYLKDQLKASSMLLSLLPSINSLSGLPFLLTSNWFVNKFGSTTLVAFGFLGYVLYSIAYSFLIDPWIALLCEITSIFTYHLLWVAVIRHSHEIAPEGLTATVVSTAGGLHFGVGKGTGSLIGGLIMSKFGGKMAFRVIAAICASAAALYGSFLLMRWRQKKNLNLQDTKEIGVTGEKRKLSENSKLTLELRRKFSSSN